MDLASGANWDLGEVHHLLTTAHGALLCRHVSGTWTCMRLRTVDKSRLINLVTNFRRVGRSLLAELVEPVVRLC
jgi:hypothetical protein